MKMLPPIHLCSFFNKKKGDICTNKAVAVATCNGERYRFACNPHALNCANETNLKVGSGRQWFLTSIAHAPNAQIIAAIKTEKAIRDI